MIKGSGGLLSIMKLLREGFPRDTSDRGGDRLVRKQGNRIRNEEETQGAIGEIKLGNVRSDVTVREWQVLRPPRRYEGR